MADAYEEFADMFMGTLAAELSGVTRELVIARAKSTYPDEEAFKAFLKSAQVQVEQQLAKAKASLKPGQVLGVGYPIDSASGTVH